MDDAAANGVFQIYGFCVATIPLYGLLSLLSPFSFPFGMLLSIAYNSNFVNLLLPYLYFLEFVDLLMPRKNQKGTELI